MKKYLFILAVLLGAMPVACTQQSQSEPRSVKHVQAVFRDDMHPTDNQVVRMEDGNDYEWESNRVRWVAAPSNDPNSDILECTTVTCPGNPKNEKLDNLLRRDVDHPGEFSQWHSGTKSWVGYAPKQK